MSKPIKDIKCPNCNRLIQMNQWGSYIYVGKYKKGVYRNWGDYAEDLNSQSIE